MAVIPSGTPEPWQWAKVEVDQNNRLMQMFLQDQQRKDALAAHQQEAALGREFSASQQASTQQFNSSERSLDRDLQRELTDARGIYHGRMPAGMKGDASTFNEAEHGSRYRELEIANGLPPGSLSVIRALESSGGRNLVNPRSRARGDFQFMPTTGRQYGLDDAGRMDPIKSAEAAAQLARDNAALFRSRMGREPNVGELYLMHQQGAGGALKLLQAGDQKAMDVVGVQETALNGGNSGTRASQLANKWIFKGEQLHGLWKRSQGGAPGGGASVTANASPNPQAVPSAPQQPVPTAAPQAATQQQQPAAAATPAPAQVAAAPPAPTQGGGGKPKVERVVGPDGKVKYRIVQ